MKMLMMTAVILTSFAGVPLAVQAKVLSVNVQHISCAGLDPRAGATSVVFSGNLGGESYFNITHVQFGIPFSQQARVLGMRPTLDGFEFKLQTMILGGTVYLRLVNGTSEGRLTSSSGDDGLLLNCSAQISD